MFEIAWSEILIVAVVAVIVVGPNELPGMLRAFGRILGQVRRTAGEFQKTFSDALKEAERQANVDKMRKDLDEVRAIDPTKDLRKSLDDVKRQMSGRVGDTAGKASAGQAAPVPPQATLAPETSPAAAAASPTPSSSQPVEAPTQIPPTQPVAAAAAAAVAPAAPVGPFAPAKTTVPALDEPRELPRAAGERR